MWNPEMIQQKSLIGIWVLSFFLQAACEKKKKKKDNLREKKSPDSNFGMHILSCQMLWKPPGMLLKLGKISWPLH